MNVRIQLLWGGVWNFGKHGNFKENSLSFHQQFILIGVWIWICKKCIFFLFLALQTMENSQN
jgi:hypothetical protein